MKAKLHIPIEEIGGKNISMWSFIDLDVEVGSIAEALTLYNSSQRLKTAPESGLDDKEWRKALDGYLTLNTLPSEVYERMNDSQRGVIQEIKKSIKRLSPEKELRQRE